MIELLLLASLIVLAIAAWPLLERLADRVRDRVLRFVAHFEDCQANLPRRVPRPELIRLAWLRVALLATAAVVIVLVNFFIGVALGLAAYLAPHLLVERARDRHYAELEAQLPDAVAILVRSVRTQGSLSRAIVDVVHHTTGAAAYEFGRIDQEYASFGLQFDVALSRARERVPVEGFRMMTSALSISLRNGGDLASVLDGIARSTRALTALQEKISTESAGVRGQMRVMVPAAFGFVLLSGVFAQGAYQFLFGTLVGNLVLTVICLIQLFAWWQMRKILKSLI